MSRNIPGGIRVLRVPLPVEKLDEIDYIIREGVGGFRDRQELITEAIDAYLIELRYEGSSPDRKSAEKTSSGLGRPVDSSRALGEDLVTLAKLPDCATASFAPESVSRGPLFGLHNRDFPSLWAAWQLAAMTRDDLAPLQDFLEKVVANAWKVGDILEQAKIRNGGPKLAALFPTNVSKPGSSEDAFKSFAIGACSLAEGKVRCSGPLFLWGVCAAEPRGSEVYLGLTERGKVLLTELNGISARVPHRSELADAFLRFLQIHALEDWWGFKTVLSVASSHPTRQEVLSYFDQQRDHIGATWSKYQVESYAAGYISRCREWGVLEPKLLHNRYYLSDYGTTLYAATVTGRG